ncbi:MAG: hypothetical protein LC620_04240, partial [Halobacteriales archaeon]|nr:hypothetical protein [Halobacteriales archaeon]
VGMARAGGLVRALSAVALVVVGLAVTAFSALLYLVADCGSACRLRGEHAPIYAAAGVGFGCVLAGALLHRGWRAALLAGTGVAGLAGLAASVWALAIGEGGWVWVGAAAGALALAAALARRRAWQVH